MTELKNCPFCSGKAYLISQKCSEKDVDYFIECSHCEVRSKKFCSATTISPIKIAMQFWNRRESDLIDAEFPEVE